MLTRSEKMRHFGIYLGSWFLSTSLAFGCGSGIHFLCQYEQEVPTFIHDYSLKQGCPDHSPVRFCVLWAKKKKKLPPTNKESEILVKCGPRGLVLDTPA